MLPPEHGQRVQPLALPPSVQLGPGSGGLRVVRVDAPTGSAEIYLHGAHVTGWTPRGGEPVLWMSAASRFDPDSPLRGGIPICFPWFGAHGTDPSAPAHGFARLADWELQAARDEGDDVVVTLGLTDSDQTRASAWPHPFEATCTITVGARLRVELEVTNRGESEIRFEEALHTYLRVTDVRTVSLTGLDGAPFLDRLAGPEPIDGERTPVRFTGETDRIYLGSGAPVTVHDEGAARSLHVAKLGSRSTVVWNPWITKAAAMADFGDDEWTQMVCVETANVRDDAVVLAPGESHTMTAVLTAASRQRSGSA